MLFCQGLDCVLGRFVDEDNGVDAPTIAWSASLVEDRLSGDAAMALSLCCDPPGADVIDFVSNSCVVGIFNGMGRDGEIGSDEAGGGAVADGITTSAGRGTATVGSAGTTAMGWGSSTGAATGVFVMAELSGFAVGGVDAVPPCPGTTAGARIIAEAKIPTSCRADTIA